MVLLLLVLRLWLLLRLVLLCRPCPRLRLLLLLERPCVVGSAPPSPAHPGARPRSRTLSRTSALCLHCLPFEMLAVPVCVREGGGQRCGGDLRWVGDKEHGDGNVWGW